MNIEKLSITGADDNVDPTELKKFSELLPETEWAILFSEQREGTLRYPSKEWRLKFYQQAPDVNRAAHLCGSPKLTMFAEGNPELKEELKNYQRVQLNFNINHIKPHILEGLIEKTKSQFYKNKNGDPIQIITQYNDANKDVHSLFKCENHAVLFDASGGKGVELQTIPLPLEGITCGYAGKLGPENLESKIKLIEETIGNKTIWVDMESGVRTDNILDREKVEQVINTVLTYKYNNTEEINI